MDVSKENEQSCSMFFESEPHQTLKDSSEKLQLRSSYTQREDVSVCNPDMDGFVIVLQNFTSINAPLPYINFKQPIGNAHATLKKTGYSDRLVTELILSNVLGECRLSVASSCHKTLGHFRSQVQDIMMRLRGRDLESMTFQRNVLNNGFLKVNKQDSSRMLQILDMALRNMRQKFLDVSIGVFVILMVLPVFLVDWDNISLI